MVLADIFEPSLLDKVLVGDALVGFLLQTGYNGGKALTQFRAALVILWGVGVSLLRCCRHEPQYPMA